MSVIKSCDGSGGVVCTFVPLVFQLYDIVFGYVPSHHFCLMAHEVDIFNFKHVAFVWAQYLVIVGIFFVQLNRSLFNFSAHFNKKKISLLPYTSCMNAF